MPERPYDKRLWKAVRLQVLDRDRWTCRHCGKPGNVADHVVDWRDGGAWFDPANLQCLCRACNSRKALPSRGDRAGWRLGPGTASAASVPDPGPSRVW